MRIVSLALDQRRVDFDFGNAGTRWQSRESALVELEAADGRRGRGEAAPLPGFSSGDLGQCLAALKMLAEKLPVELESLGEIERLTRTLEPAAARCAVETALLDLWAQHLSLPICAVLGSAREHLALAGVIDADPADLEGGLEKARKLAARGITTFKLKVGRVGRLPEELEWLAALRRELGWQPAFRLDANRQIAAADLARTLDVLACCRPVLIEEPSSAAATAALETSPIAIALDESVRKPGDLDAFRPLIERGLCRALVLKPMAQGLFACMELAHVARELGMATYVTHLFDGPIGLAAAAHLALALPGEVWACGLDRHPGLALAPEIDLPWFGANAITRPTCAGLGLEVQK